MTPYAIVMTTFPDEEKAQYLIRAALEQKLAACVQTVPIGSQYVWEGELHKETEVLILFKTQKALAGELTTQITMMHPYEVPEILTVDIADGNAPYLQWMQKQTKDPVPAAGGPGGQKPAFSMASTEALLKQLGAMARDGEAGKKDEEEQGV